MVTALVYIALCLSISAICKEIPEGNPEGSDSDPYQPLGSAKGESYFQKSPCKERESAKKTQFKTSLPKECLSTLKMGCSLLDWIEKMRLRRDSK